MYFQFCEPVRRTRRGSNAQVEVPFVQLHQVGFDAVAQVGEGLRRSGIASQAAPRRWFASQSWCLRSSGHELRFGRPVGRAGRPRVRRVASQGSWHSWIIGVSHGEYGVSGATAYKTCGISEYKATTAMNAVPPPKIAIRAIRTQRRVRWSDEFPEFEGDLVKSDRYTENHRGVSVLGF